MKGLIVSKMDWDGGSGSEEGILTGGTILICIALSVMIRRVR